MAVEKLTAEEKTALKGVNKTTLNEYESRESFSKDFITDNVIGLPSTVKKSFTVLEAEQYVQTVQKEISKIMNDDVYDARQKAVMLERIALDKQEEYFKKIDDLLEAHNEPFDDINEYLDAEINAHERVTPLEQREIEFTNQETMSRVKTDLMLSTTPDKVADSFKKLLDQSQHNRYKARFLAHNGYLFLERISQLPEGPERDRAFSIIRMGINKAQNAMQTDKGRALAKMKKNLGEMKRTGEDGKRLIKQNADQIIKRAQELARQHKYAEQRKVENEALILFNTVRR